MSAFRQHFLSDSIEKLAALRARFANEPDRDAFRELVRAFHTIKGGGRMFSLPSASEFALFAEEELHTRADSADCVALVDRMLLILRGADSFEILPAATGGNAKIAFSDIPGHVFRDLATAECDRLVESLSRSTEVAAGTLRFSRERFAAEFASFRTGISGNAGMIAMVPVESESDERKFYVIVESDAAFDTEFGRISPVGRTVSDSPTLAALFEAAVADIGNLADTLGKSIETRVFANVFEPSRTVRTALTTALIHLVRNAADHALGERGRIDITLFLDSASVQLRVADDGRGIDTDELRRRAAKLNPGAELPADVIELISLAGLSTAETVTEISGRGVGFETVRAEIAALNGKISVENRNPKGTAFEIVIPVDPAEAIA